MLEFKELVLFQTQDEKISLPVNIKDNTVWLNRNQMAELFNRDVKTIGKHVNNAQGYAVNNNRIQQLGEVIRLMIAQIEGLAQ